MHNVVIPFAIAVAILLFDAYKARKHEEFKFGFLGYALVFLGFILYVSAFLTDDFTLKEVFLHSSKSLDPIFKLSASWSGSGGFIVWWLFIFTLLALIQRLRLKDRVIFFYYDLMIVALFFTALLNGAFDSLDFVPKNGAGLNPLLKTFWMLLHPPASFIGYALGLFVAIDVFLNRENRFAVSLTWLFVTLANVLGGVWSYYTLGWGGYWAWDPVETGLLLPWLTLTAYFHSNSLRKSLLALTGFSVAFAGFVTRGGISSLHGFAVNPSGFVIILLGVPFLIKALKEFRFELKLKPMNVATLSLLGSYFVCLMGLIYQLIFAVSGSKVSVNVDYYNFANMPFLVALLSVLPICRDKKYGSYLKVLAVVYAISVVLTLLTLVGYINWCEEAPIHVNSAVSFVLPIALFSFASVIKLQKPELKIIHLAIPLLVIAVSISWPYAYYANYKSIVVDKNGTNVDGLRIQLLSVEFHEPVGSVSIGGAVEIPEESYEIVKLNVNGANVESKVRINLAWLLSGREFVFPEPTIVNAGLDNYYMVIPNIYAFDLFMFTCKYLYEQNETHILKFVAELMGFDYKEFVNNIKEWKPKEEVVILYKRIPLVNLVWISCALMVIGEITALVRWKK